MKKVFNIVFSLFLIGLIFQFVINFFVTKRNYNYSIKTNTNSYIIKENYKRNGKLNTYSFNILEDNKNRYVYSYEGDLNKQSRVIKDIISYNKNNLSCIAPVLRNNVINSIICRYNNEIVSYTYLKQIGNIEVDNFINELSNTNYKVNTQYKDINVNKTDFGRISYYNDIDPNLYFTVWNYNSLYVVNGENTKEEEILSKDEYENDKSILIDKYYVSFSNDGYYNGFYIINVKDGGNFKLIMENDETLSPNFYFNGIYKNKLYITDIDKKKQYVLDPKHEKIVEEKNPKYYDGKVLNSVDISILTSEYKYFIENDISNELILKYGNSIKYTNNNYYFVDNGKVYEIINDNYDDKVLLFSFTDFKEFRVLNGNLFGVSNGTIYMYNDTLGLKKVIDDRELIYNSKNIYDVYEK